MAIYSTNNSPFSVNPTTAYSGQTSSVNTTNSTDFSDILKNAQGPVTLDSIFQQAAATYNVPLSLLKAVAKAESGYRADAVSPCGAQGIMQLMPQTSASLGVTNPFDPEENIMAGAKCLAQKLKAYDGDIKLTLASYNAGSGNVKKYGGIPPFKETKNYIEKVLGYMNTDHAASTLSSDTSVQALNQGNPISMYDGLLSNSDFSFDRMPDASQLNDGIEETINYAKDALEVLKNRARILQMQTLLDSVSEQPSDESGKTVGVNSSSDTSDYSYEDYLQYLTLANLTNY